MALIVVAATIAYHNCFHAPFVFDDLPAITDNTSIRQLSRVRDVLLPEQAGGVTTSGRPLVNLSLALNYALGGHAVWGYHATNLAIHLGGALCLLGLVHRTLLRPKLRARFGAAALPLATTTALLWALHPLQTESVTYIVQRAESLVGFFYLVTLYAFARAVDSRPPAGNGAEISTAAAAQRIDEQNARASAPAGRRWLAASVVACGLGMATKEVMVSAPFVVLLYDRTFVSGTFAEAWRRHRGAYLGLAATWLVLLALVLHTGARGGTAGFGTELSSWSYALTQCQALARYVALTLWPFPLVFDYGHVTTRALAEVLPQALALLATLAGTVVALRRAPVVGFLGASFFALLAPSSSFVPIATQTIAEHRMYLPVAALAAGAVSLSYLALGRRAFAVWAGVLVALGLATAARNGDYRTELTLWSDTARKFPANARAHNNLGQAQFRAGRIAASISSYERAAQLEPHYAEPRYNLGVSYAALGDLPRAMGEYEHALRIEPRHAEALNNLGNALLKSGRADEALRRYHAAVEQRPSFAEAHYNLGNALLEANRPAEARPHFERALQLQPGYPEALYGLGNVFAGTGDMAAALAQYRAALQARPDYAIAHVNAGNALLELQRPNEALEHYDRAVKADPALVDAHYNRGSVLLGLERWTEAAAAFEAALRLRPDSAPAHRALGVALARSGRRREAVPHYRAYLRQHPDDREARAELAELEQARP